MRRGVFRLLPVIPNRKHLVYDLETTGLNPVHDRALQIAALVTDEKFNPLETYNYRIRLDRSVIPHPKATMVHKIPLQKWAMGISESDAFRKMHALCNTPDTTNWGFNSLAFDDQFLRFGFQRNLLQAYTHQYANGCSRMDLYPIALMFWIFKKAPGLTWPTRDQKPSFKLADFKEANDLAKGKAHDAMVDVNATVELARRLRGENSGFWDEVVTHFDKPKDIFRMTSGHQERYGNNDYRLGFIVKRGNAVDNHFLAPVVCLGVHAHYTNQTLYLRLDKESLHYCSTANIPKKTAIIRKKAGDLPIFLPYEKAIADLLTKDAKRLYNENMQFLVDNPELFRRIAEYHQNRKYDDVVNVDAYSTLYQTGFPTEEEVALFQAFHDAPPSEKSKIAAKITRPVYHELAIRIIGHHFPEHLSAQDKVIFDRYLLSTVHPETAPIDYRGRRALSIPEALQETKKLTKEEEHSPAEKKLLRDMKKWYAGYPDRLFQAPKICVPENSGCFNKPMKKA